MLSCLSDNFADPGEKPFVIEKRLADGNAISIELSSVSQEARRMSERSHGNWPIVGGHAAELITRHQHRFRSEVGGPKSRSQAGGTSADNYDIYHIYIFKLIQFL